MKAKAELSPTYQIVNMICRRGNQPGIIREWFDGLRKWASENTGPDAEALRCWMDIARVRPFYTAEELAPLWPALKLTLGLASRLDPAPGANRLHNELVFHGMPKLQNAETGSFEFFESHQRYFIVEHVHRWRNNPIEPGVLASILAGGEIP